MALTSLRNLKLHGRKLSSISMDEIGMMVSPRCHCMLMKGQACEIWDASVIKILPWFRKELHKEPFLFCKRKAWVFLTVKTKTNTACNRKTTTCQYVSWFFSFLSMPWSIDIPINEKKKGNHLLSLFFLNLEMFCKFNVKQSNVLACFFHF